MIPFQELKEETRGWMNETSAALIEYFLSKRAGSSEPGDVLEVGVWRGQSAALIASCMRDDTVERLYLSDLFEAPIITASETTVSVLEAQKWWDANPPLSVGDTVVLVRKLTGKTPICVKGPSGALDLPGPFRFVHVDGGHDETTCRADCEYSLGALRPGGVLCVDDYDNETYPGVRRAVDALMREGKCSLILVAGGKAYVERS